MANFYTQRISGEVCVFELEQRGQTPPHTAPLSLSFPLFPLSLSFLPPTSQLLSQVSAISWL